MTTTPQATPEQLSAARTEVIGEISRADGKAGTLLAALGLPMAVLVAVLPSRDLSTTSATLAGLGAVGLTAAMLTVLAVVRPHLQGEVRGSFLYWANCTKSDQVASSLAEDHTAARLIKLSQIAKRKYTSLRIAIDITSGSLALLALAVLVSLV